MINCEQIAALTANEDILIFAGYVLPLANGQPFIPFEQFDMMNIAAVADRAFVFTVRPINGKRLLFRYSGADLEKKYGQNLAGKYYEDVYNGSAPASAIHQLYNVIDRKRIGYTRRIKWLGGETMSYRKIERIAIPCSVTGAEIDHVIGVTCAAADDDAPDNECEMLL